MYKNDFWGEENNYYHENPTFDITIKFWQELYLQELKKNKLNKKTRKDHFKNEKNLFEI